MKRQNRWSAVATTLAVLTLGTSLWAASPTKITIPDMECNGCAKKVAVQLKAVPGVGTIQTDVPTKIATVTPKGDTSLSPRQLWEAVEKAGKEPSKLEGPSGTFTSKPQS
jgi:copper chaperone CopZ